MFESPGVVLVVEAIIAVIVAIFLGFLKFGVNRAVKSVDSHSERISSIEKIVLTNDERVARNVKVIENHDSRISEIEREYVTHPQLNKEIDSIRAEIREGNRVTHSRLENLQIALYSLLKK